MKSYAKIGIIGVPQDLGASRRGVDMGPSAMRVAGLRKTIVSLGYEVQDYGNLHCHDINVSSMGKSSSPNLNHLDAIIDTCQHLKDAVETCNEVNHFPLVIGGDHSVSIGSLAGMKSLHSGKTGIIWIDAHGDFNTPETTPSGNIHGMPFAVLNNRGAKKLLAIGPSPTVIEANSVLLAARDIDKAEAQLLKDSQVTVFTMKDIDEKGIAVIAKEAIVIATKGVDHLHVSFDIDALDPEVAPGTGTTVLGGLTFREAHLIMELVHETGKLSSFELLEVNPTLDVRNKTAKLAVGLIATALGKKIL